MGKHIEDIHQEVVINWSRHVRLPKADHIEEQAKVFDYLYAIPNGGKRGKFEAARLKRQGVKAGVSDLHLALPMGRFHGLYIEMKKPIVKGESKPQVSAYQREWLTRASKAGYQAVVCYGAEQAKEMILNYISEYRACEVAA